MVVMPSYRALAQANCELPARRMAGPRSPLPVGCPRASPRMLRILACLVLLLFYTRSSYRRRSDLA